MDETAITAIGHVITLLGTYLERANGEEPGQFGGKLAVYAEVIRENDEEAAQLMAEWAMMALAAAEGIKARAAEQTGNA